MNTTQWLVLVSTLVAILAVFAGLSIIENKEEHPSQTPEASDTVSNTSAPSTTANATSGMISYRDEMFGFAIEFPQKWSASEEEYPGAAGDLPWTEAGSNGEELLWIYAPMASTSPLGAEIEVGAGATTSTDDIAFCETGEQEVLNDTTFYRNVDADGGAGTWYHYVVYKTERLGTCYAIEYILTDSIGDVENSSTYDNVESLLNRTVLQSLTFTARS